jgi:hypothetical protein
MYQNISLSDSLLGAISGEKSTESHRRNSIHQMVIVRGNPVRMNAHPARV